MTQPQSHAHPHFTHHWGPWSAAVPVQGTVIDHRHVPHLVTRLLQTRSCTDCNKTERRRIFR